jgi:plastocyanin
MLAADGCGWERIEVDAVDFGYEGLPESLPAGKYAVVMTNGTEAGEQHEIGFVRPKEDTTETFDELLELPEDESMEKVDFVDAAFAPPGETGVVFLELEPGTYYYACFIPVGSGSEEPSEGAPPHFAAGMKGELTVD